MGWLRIKKRMLTPDECAGELYDIVFWVHSYFKSTFIEENEGMDEDQLIQIIKDRNYEMLLLTLWVMHTYLPSEKLRGKVYERFFKAVSYGSSDVGRLLPLDTFQEDIRARLKAYTCAYDK